VQRLIALGVALVALAACDTWQGFGRDLEAAGNAISRSAERAKK
jgi:predicted small secreted protein